MLRRPAIAAALSLTFVLLLSLISDFKHDVLWMTVSFVDVMIIDYDAVHFLFSTIPGLTLKAVLAAAVLVPLLVLLWRFDPFRMRRRTAAAGLPAASPPSWPWRCHSRQEEWEAFAGNNYVSKFSRSGVDAIATLLDAGHAGIGRHGERCAQAAAGGKPASRRRGRRTSSWCMTSWPSTSGPYRA